MTFNMYRAVKGPLSVQLCYCSCSCWASSSSCSAGPVWTSNRGKDLPKGFRAESWLNVWFLVFLRVEMCLVWSWFGLSLICFWLFFELTSFIFELARWCYCYLFRWSACLFIWASFFLETFMFRCKYLTTQMLQTYKALTSLCPPRLSPPRSLCPPHTPTHSNTPKTSPQTLLPLTTPSLCSAASVPLHLPTDFFVFLQSRKASEQAKSVDSKTDSIGSGRAIPIKQVSSFIIIPLYVISCYMGE